jgi:hypothetical protein
MGDDQEHMLSLRAHDVEPVGRALHVRLADQASVSSMTSPVTKFSRSMGRNFESSMVLWKFPRMI